VGGLFIDFLTCTHVITCATRLPLATSNGGAAMRLPWILHIVTPTSWNVPFSSPFSGASVHFNTVVVFVFVTAPPPSA